MPVNVWSAGQDALLNTLATRDAARRLQEDRDRRDRLDQEVAADRARQREIQEGTLRSVEEDRVERRRMAGEQVAAKKAEQEANTAKQREIDAALQTFATAQDPQEKMRAAAVLDKYKVSPSALRDLQKPSTKSVFGVDPRSGSVRQFGEVPIGAQVINIPKPDGPAAGPKDDPRLPQGTKAWIESIAQRGVPIEKAREELSMGWAQQRAAHPHADLAAAAQHLQRLYMPDGMGGRSPIGSPQPGGEVPPAAPTPEAAAPPAGAETPAQQLFNDAHAVVSQHLGRNASPQEVQAFLSDPRNVAQLAQMTTR